MGCSPVAVSQLDTDYSPCDGTLPSERNFSVDVPFPCFEIDACLVILWSVFVLSSGVSEQICVQGK